MKYILQVTKTAFNLGEIRENREEKEENMRYGN